MYIRAAAFAVIFINGCATVISPKTLEEAKNNECIVIEETTSWKEPRGIVGLTWEEGLIAGVYEAEYENKEGVFFRGNGRSVWQRTYPTSDPDSVEHKASVSEGGIWLPKTSAKTPRIYYYFEAQPHTTDDINAYTTSVATNSSVSPGASGGTSAAGTALGGAIVSAMIQMDVGKIIFFPEIKDPMLLGKMRNINTCTSEE